MSLRFRINLLFSLLSLAFLLVLGFVVTDNLRSSVREEVAAATRVTVQMLRAFVVEADRAGASRGNPQASNIRHEPLANQCLRQAKHFQRLFQSRAGGFIRDVPK